MKKLLFALIFLSSLHFNAQESSHRADVLRYLTMNGTANQYSAAIDQLFELLGKQYQEHNISDEVWGELKKESTPELNKILNMLVSAYRGIYEHEDIKNMIAFYETSTGKQLLADKTALTSEQQKEASVFYNSPTGQKILTSEQQIAHRVGEVSEIWSRDLYRNLVDKLAEKGYVMQQ
ncbi:DUF2059 domain-containing protein [Dokdonia pacifica]|uniref:DUF2059 domain-containing protein n=2 Tax=Dokdonia pacifica TaxID=1627892 RepID=A0A239ARP0_9FLAO|nr:DUF2059 domain-containing protein [Dokdonia pacifica]SNR97613.1 hypothetical protein SAMN06265376_10556 [Dokdonia pacifica]